MEGEEDEFGELYKDMLPFSSLSYSIPPFNMNMDNKNTIMSSKNELCPNEPKVENEDELEIHGGFVESEKEMDIKDANYTILSHFNNNEGLGFVKPENRGRNSVKENDATEDVNLSTLSHSENGMGCESDEKQEKQSGNMCLDVNFIGEDEALKEKRDLFFQFKKCDSQNNLGCVGNFEEKGGFDDLKLHPMVLELMSNTSVHDVCDDGEDTINLRALNIANDCGISVNQDEDSDGGFDSENGLNLIFTDEEISRRVGGDEKEACKSGILGSVRALPTSYDDDSYDFEDNWTGLRGSCEDVLHTRSDFFLPSYQTIFDINIDDLKEKRWRRPGVNLTDYFNFGLNELEWKNYYKKMKNEKNPLSLFATSASKRCQQGEACSTKMDKKSRGKVAGDSYEQSTTPTAEAIQVKMEAAERFPYIYAKNPRLSHFDSVVEIIVHDDNSDNNNNAQIPKISSCQSASYFRNINVDSFWPFPLDWPYHFFVIYGQLACLAEERNFQFRNERKDRVEEGPSTRPENLRKTRSRKPTLTYPDDRKEESQRKYISELIRKYGDDNDSKDDRKPKNEVHARIKYRNGAAEGSRIRKRHETCTSDARRSVWDRVSNTQKNVQFRENEKKRPRDEGDRTKIWSGKRFCRNDPESDREEGEIVSTQRQVSTRKYDYRGNKYLQEKAVNQSSRQKPRKRPFLRSS